MKRIQVTIEVDVPVDLTIGQTERWLKARLYARRRGASGAQMHPVAVAGLLGCR